MLQVLQTQRAALIVCLENIPKRKVTVQLLYHTSKDIALLLFD